ncbi:DUF4275 family protein [Paenibacillus sp. 2TAB26]|uniref:DUF4275 family protein n=1 Tax=Paenibacillus sp. 2TAB26 TaxID=3233005 RepID=UPI003F950485
MFSKKRHVRIDWECSIEDETDARVCVYVTFPDYSRWVANFYTVKCIESIRNDRLSRGDNTFVWSEENLIIVDQVSRAHIEKIIDESIEQNTFEYLFKYFGWVHAPNVRQYPGGFFESKGTIDPIIISSQASTLREMLEHASDELREVIKQFLFGEWQARIEHLKLIPKLEAKHMRVAQAELEGRDMKREWEDIFAEGLDAQEKTNIYMEQYLWHVFSYAKKSCLSDEQAVEAFRNEPKKACYVFYQQHDLVLLIEDAARLMPEDVEGEQDIYIVDEHFKWTYVVTHESELGPYFVKAQYTR